MRASASRLLLFSLQVAVAGNLGGSVQSSRPGEAATGGINRADQREKPHVVLISFDGFRPDYLDRFDVPHFRRVLRRGARATSMLPVFPTVTFPNHYSLVTGLYAEQHGIVENTFFDPQRNATYSFRDQQSVGDGTWYRGEPIWVTAELQGMVAACFFWPGSEAPIKGVRPSHWRKYDQHVPNRTRVDTVLEWLRLPAERRPHVITMYFSDVDAASHQGPLNSRAVRRAVGSLDATLGALLDGLDRLPIRDRVYLLLTSDHGMVETSARRTLLLGSLIDTETVRVGFTGPVTGLHTANAGEDPRDLRDLINGRLKHGRAYLREELPERYHYRKDPRAGDVVIVMEESWTISTSIVSTLRLWQAWGHHGWDPALPSMRAMFAIAGPGVRQNVVVPEVQTIDVYPLMTELLGLEAPVVDGRRGYIRKLITK